MSRFSRHTTLDYNVYWRAKTVGYKIKVENHLEETEPITKEITLVVRRNMSNPDKIGVYLTSKESRKPERNLIEINTRTGEIRGRVSWSYNNYSSCNVEDILNRVD